MLAAYGSGAATRVERRGQAHPQHRHRRRHHQARAWSKAARWSRPRPCMSAAGCRSSMRRPDRSPRSGRQISRGPRRLRLGARRRGRRRRARRGRGRRWPTRWSRRSPRGRLPHDVAHLYLTDPIADFGAIDGVMFSGGVGEYVYGREDRDFGDMGRRLGRAIRRRIDAGALPWPLLPAGECIRATALGASEYSVQLSGNTSYISSPGALLPRRNLQVLQPRLRLRRRHRPRAPSRRRSAPISSPSTSPTTARSRSRCAGRARPPMSGSPPSPKASAAGSPPASPQGQPIYVMLDGDVAQTLGAILREELGIESDILVIDGVVLMDFDYIDLGRIRLPSNTVPVTIKSLVFSEDPRGPRPRQRLHHHAHDEHGHEGHGHHHHDHAHRMIMIMRMGSSITGMRMIMTMLTDHSHDHGHSHSHAHGQGGHAKPAVIGCPAPINARVLAVVGTALGVRPVRVDAPDLRLTCKALQPRADLSPSRRAPFRRERRDRIARATILGLLQACAVVRPRDRLSAIRRGPSRRIHRDHVARATIPGPLRA